MLEIRVETGNAAFGDTPEEALAESARILRVVAGGMEAGSLSGAVQDANGNTVGKWELNAE